jgi:hypothetical protein
MKTCWTILGIPYTTDKQLIKKTCWSLMKQYHPDTVRSPEKKRKHTIKCYDINRAYEEAMLEAQRGLQRTGAAIASNTPSMGHHSSFWMEYHTHVAHLAAISILTGLAFFAGSPGWHVLIHSVTLATLGKAILVAFWGCLLSGFLGVFELSAFFICGFILLIILGSLGLATTFDKIWNKAIWTFMVCANAVVVYLGPLAGMNDFFSRDPLSPAYTSIFRVVLVSAVPLLFLTFWVEDLIRYHKVKDKVASILIAIG